MKHLLEELRGYPADCIITLSDSDAVFLAGHEEIVEAYRGLGSPKVLMSAECELVGVIHSSIKP